jgi:hypothetical protein
VSRCRQQGCEQSFPMNSKDEDADIARILEMTEVELRAHIAAHGRDADAAAAKLTDAPIEQMEKALFGASLDDIMSLSEFTDLEIRPVGFVRQNQDVSSEPLGPARLRRDHTTQHGDSTSAREAAIPSRVKPT